MLKLFYCFEFLWNKKFLDCFDFGPLKDRLTWKTRLLKSPLLVTRDQKKCRKLANHEALCCKCILENTCKMKTSYFPVPRGNKSMSILHVNEPLSLLKLLFLWFYGSCSGKRMIVNKIKKNSLGECCIKTLPILFLI